ncbi:hypothetical protein M8J77_003922 [Diaphorina citri]|nr:hypothetical protein M8J77_003922 [Diaphorina citri]
MANQKLPYVQRCQMAKREYTQREVIFNINRQCCPHEFFQESIGVDLYQLQIIFIHLRKQIQNLSRKCWVMMIQIGTMKRTVFSINMIKITSWIVISCLSEKMPLKRIHCEFSVHHLMSVLNISHEEAKYKFKRYPNLKSRSFKCIQENVHVLTKKVGFTHERIKKNAFLLHADKENLLSLLKKYPKLGSVDMKQIIQAYPILVLSPIRNIESVIQCVQKFGYTLEHLSKAPMILILKPSTVEQRLTQIHTEEWLQPYSGLPRTLMLVLTLPSLEKRRAVLQDLNMKCISINVLACTKILFNAYVKHGRDKLNSEDAYLYLSNKLNVPFEKITQKLQSHPYKRYVSIQQIHNSLTFLLGKFSEDNIYNNLQLVLYPVNVIEAALEKLTSGSDTSLDTTPCHDANGNIKEELVLPLTLYVIEKQTNFTGYGIWEEEEEDGEVEHNANLDSPVSMLPIRKKKRKPSFRNLRRS